jgi:hypothetical protein
MTEFMTEYSEERIDPDTLSNSERMKIAIREVKIHRRLNAPDWFSLLSIDDLTNDLKIVCKLSEEEIRYAIKRVYSKRVKKYESKIVSR